MYARILVALDGSELAEQILPYVESLAERFSATVTLLRATMPVERAVTAEVGIAAGFVDLTPIIEEERREAARYLEHVAECLRRGGITVQCVQPEGSPAEVILEHARRTNGELIALTTHGRGGLGRLVFGSVADEVLRKAPCPVLLVRTTLQDKS
jgi:nucleotide-binding universal stress UspA family protein